MRETNERTLGCWAVLLFFCLSSGTLSSKKTGGGRRTTTRLVPPSTYGSTSCPHMSPPCPVYKLGLLGTASSCGSARTGWFQLGKRQRSIPKYLSTGVAIPITKGHTPWVDAMVCVYIGEVDDWLNTMADEINPLIHVSQHAEVIVGSWHQLHHSFALVPGPPNPNPVPCGARKSARGCFWSDAAGCVVCLYMGAGGQPCAILLHCKGGGGRGV